MQKAERAISGASSSATVSDPTGLRSVSMPAGFKRDALPSAIETFTTESMVAEGTVARVSVVEQKESGLKTVLKQPADPNSEVSELELKREMRIVNAMIAKGCEQVPSFALKIGEAPLRILYEFVPLSLHGALGEKAASVDKALSIFRDICSALKALHSLEPPCYHGKLDPASIRLTPSGRAKIVDFNGISDAKLLSGLSVTQEANRALESTRWVAPEQFNGHRADAKVDVYQAAHLFFFCLTGRDLGKGETIQLDAPAVPLVPVLKRAMGNRAQRYESISELEAAVEAALKVKADTVLEHLRSAREQNAKALLPDERAAALAKTVAEGGIVLSRDFDESTNVAICPNAEFLAWNSRKGVSIDTLGGTGHSPAVLPNSRDPFFSRNTGELIVADGPMLSRYRLSISGTTCKAERTSEESLGVFRTQSSESRSQYKDTLFPRRTSLLGASGDGSVVFAARKGLLHCMDLSCHDENGTPKLIWTKVYSASDLSNSKVICSAKGERALIASRREIIDVLDDAHASDRTLLASPSGVAMSPGGSFFAYAGPEAGGVKISGSTTDGRLNIGSLFLPAGEVAMYIPQGDRNVLIGGSDGTLFLVQRNVEKQTLEITAQRSFSDPIKQVEVIPDSPLILVRTTKQIIVLAPPRDRA